MIHLPSLSISASLDYQCGFLISHGMFDDQIVLMYIYNVQVQISPLQYNV